MGEHVFRTSKSWIQKTPDVCGGDPCIRDTRITVHGLVEYRNLGVSDNELLEQIAGLRPEDLETAWAYYLQNQQEIDDILRAEAEGLIQMAQLLADEDFPYGAVTELRNLGHDVVTVREAGIAGSTDAAVLAHAISIGRAVVTHNRRHYIKLHRQVSPHRGIVVCTRGDNDWAALANRIHQAIAAHATLDNQLIRVTRPVKP